MSVARDLSFMELLDLFFGWFFIDNIRLVLCSAGKRQFKDIIEPNDKNGETNRMQALSDWGITATPVFVIFAHTIG